MNSNEELHTTASAGHARTLRSIKGVLEASAQVVARWKEDALRPDPAIEVTVAAATEVIGLENIISEVIKRADVPDGDSERLDWVQRLSDSRRVAQSANTTAGEIVRDRCQTINEHLINVVEQTPLRAVEIIESTLGSLVNSIKQEPPDASDRFAEALRLGGTLAALSEADLPSDVVTVAENRLTKIRRGLVNSVLRDVVARHAIAELKREIRRRIPAMRELLSRAQTITRQVGRLEKIGRSQIEQDDLNSNNSLAGRAVTIVSLSCDEVIESLLEHRSVASITEFAQLMSLELVDRLQSQRRIPKSTATIVEALDTINPEEVFQLLTKTCKETIRENGIYEVLDADEFPELASRLWHKAEPLGGPTIQNADLGVEPVPLATVRLPKPCGATETLKGQVLRSAFAKISEGRIDFFEDEATQDISLTRYIFAFPWSLERQAGELLKRCKKSIERGSYPTLIDYLEDKQ